MLKLFSRLVDFVNKPFFESPEVYDFLDNSEGKLTPEEVLKIAKPLASERGWTYQNDKITVGNEEPYLVREKGTNKVFWFVNFSILSVNGEEIAPQCDRTLGYVSIEDATGAILEVRGKKE